VCGVGVAPRALLSAVVILQEGSVSDAVEARAINYALDVNYIFSNSWGPIDDGTRKEAPGPLTRRAFQHAITNGRHGLGTIFVWAAGNGKRQNDNCNYDGYANMRYTITIGSVNWYGQTTWYSEPCSALLGVTPSSGTAPKDPAIVTTDLLGNSGQDPSDCNKKFTGTSSSCALAAGIIALMLEVNPKLTWLEVQYVLVNSTIKNDPNDVEWVQNGAGRWVNHKYGFGLIDAQKAIENAKKYDSEKNRLEEIQSTYRINPKQPFNGSLSISIEVTDSPIRTLHHVEIWLNLTHHIRGELRIALFSPSKTESVLASPHRDQNADYIWTFVSLRYWGENPNGNWTLIIDNGTKQRQPSILNEWGLTFYGLVNHSTRTEPRSYPPNVSTGPSPLILHITSKMSLPTLLLVMTSAVIFLIVVVNFFLLFCRRRATQNRVFITELEFISE
jgi:subtilisin-like proprotein convertase family protein